MDVTRATLLGGPAVATWNGHVFWARDGILVSPALDLAPVGSDAQGVLDASVFGAPVTIRFSPSAPAADLVALYPHLAGAPGGSLFGSADRPLVLVAANGVRLTFAAVALVQMPDLTLGATGAAAGTVRFLALPARGGGVNDANALATFDTATLPAAPASSPQLSDDYQLTWGAAPWAGLRARDGFHVRFLLKTQPVLSDANALLDLTLDELKIEIAFAPASPNGPAEADALEALQLQGALPGRALSAGAQPLAIVGAGFSLTMPEAQVIHADLDYAAGRGRLANVIFQAGRALMESAEALAEVSN